MSKRCEIIRTILRALNRLVFVLNSVKIVIVALQLRIEQIRHYVNRVEGVEHSRRERPYEETSAAEEEITGACELLNIEEAPLYVLFADPNYAAILDRNFARFYKDLDILARDIRDFDNVHHLVQYQRIASLRE
jgi:hypothetical protein